jgi:hypothetical protein
MTRQDALHAIGELLPQQPDEALEALVEWLGQHEDAFERRLRADAQAGRLDLLAAGAIAEYEVGDTIDLDAPCDADVLEEL